EKTVLVILHRRNGGDDQPTRPSHFWLIVTPVRVLPENPKVLLMHANGVLDNLQISPAVRHHRIEIFDVAQTIAAQLKTVRKLSHSIFTRVKGIFPLLRRGWITVRDNHF